MRDIFIISAGHGGVINNKYVTAPDKMYDHGPYEGVAYEGEINRKVVNKVTDKAKKESIKVINITDTELDLSLDLKVDIVNRINNEYPGRCLAIDFHSNGGKGTGFEIYTSPGDTLSDPIAERFGDLFKIRFPWIKYRYGYSDRGLEMDKEAPFYFLRHTNCPAILPEWMFFDNLDDWKYIRSSSHQDDYARMVVDFFKLIVSSQ